MPSFEHTYDHNVRRLHRTLMRFGWALNPHFAVGMFFSQLTDYAKNITVDQKREGSKDVALQLHRLLFRCSFSPRLRAYQVVRASKLPFLEKVSHHFEAAHFHYFKGDYLSSVLTLLPAIEGTLRSHASETVLAVLNERPEANGRVFTEKDASVPELIGAIRRRPLPPADSHDHDHRRCRLNRDLLFDVLMKWLYRPMREAEQEGNFEITHLNRHGAQHLFNYECFYTQADAERLFLIMDLYIEAIRHEFMVPTSCFLPDVGQEPSVDSRANYYSAILIGALPLNTSVRVERALLNEHKSFKFIQDFDAVTALMEDAAFYQHTLRELLEDARPNRNDGNAEDQRA